MCGLQSIAVRLIVLAPSATAARSFAALAADFRHVCTIAADHFAALASSDACLFSIKLMGGALSVRRAPALTGDLPLPLWIHAGKSARAAAATAWGLIESHTPSPYEEKTGH
jgi:hypothetical protein